MGADLKQYVKKALRKGYSEKRIRHQLRQRGWSKQEIDKAFQAANNSSNTGKIILTALLTIIVAAGGITTWLLTGSGAEPAATQPSPGTSEETPTPPSQPSSPEEDTSLNGADTENDSSSETSSAPSGNQSNSSGGLPPGVVSECELIDASQKKFNCYREKLEAGLNNVNCRALPQPDRGLCTHAYESLVTT